MLVKEETYRRPGLKIATSHLPSLPSATGFTVVEAYILKAGIEMVDGVRREYQILRIDLTEDSQPQEEEKTA